MRCISSWSMAAEGGIHFDDAAAPEGMRLYAVGDIHGCYDLMVEMHRRIMAEIIEGRPPDWRIIYLGDYVDRGPASRQVIEFLSRTTASDPRVVALGGNHDVGFLEFLMEPMPDGMFANYGGTTTARSYGVEMAFHPLEALERSAQALRDMIPQAHMDFLRGLKLSAGFGDYFFCHAGIKPGVPLEAQSAEDLIWIRDLFLGHVQLHSKVIVHGHTPVPRPEILPNRVNLDTGAFHSGRLSAMMFEGKRKRLLEVGR
ncbi:metallophosphoesterase [Chelativorans sp. M5D2P16]|uniref:metallophosphoesterase n=1 Tax=Chelativorans sp. M5D2P16 TaxID=3095678 RepID=UPI002ACA791D|nr:metallophosphoesterase [Chelativorans sp. M5D2P16]MDZ5698940.1 metallophosphoesterase [Chelativorans sp. M5D2P16]